MKLFISFYILLVSNLFYAQLDSSTIKIWNQFSSLDDSLNYTLFIGGPSSVGFNLYFDSSRLQPFENGSLFTKEQADLPFIYQKVPVLDFQYIIGDQLEQNLAIYHSQPISNRSNYSLSFLKRSHDGYYLNQATNSNFLQANYFRKSKKENYTINASLKHHRLYNEQNGGIQNDSSFTDANFDILNRNLIPINMNHGFSNDKLWKVNMQQTIYKSDSSSKSKKFDIITSFDRRFRNYYDSLNANLFLFNHFDTNRSNDTLVQKDFRQQINYYLSYYEDSILTKSMVIFYDVNRITYSNHADDTVLSNHNIGLKYNLSTPQYNFNTTIRYTPFGFRRNNFNFHMGYNRNLTQKIKFSSSLNTKRITPNYVFHQYSSNHVIWNNRVNDMYYIGLNTAITLKNIRLKSNQFWLKNPMYFNRDLTPVSTLDTVQIVQTSIEYMVNKKKMEFNIEFQHQYQGGLSIYQLPEWLAFGSFYYKFLHAKSDAKLYLGVRVRSFSSFNLMEFSPQINQFLVSNERKQESYLIADLTAKAEIKNVTIFAMVAHINSGLLGYRYFTLLHYPQPDRYFKFGLKWLFLD